MALYGGGGIYFKNKLPFNNLSPNKTNTFKDNEALFSNDFYSFAVRAEFYDNNNYHSLINKNKLALSLIPGFTNFSLYFSVVDFFGQTLKSLPLR